MVKKLFGDSKAYRSMVEIFQQCGFIASYLYPNAI